MGTVTLKKKQELNYKRGSAAHDCSECDHYMPNYVPMTYGEWRRFEPRCSIMGLKPGRAYRISPKFICDAHNNSEHLKRLGQG